MTDVRDAPRADNDARPKSDEGGFIWYELISPDPTGSKKFYDALVGWDIATNSVAPGIEYRMIGRSDGGLAGGILTLTDDMRSHGARPMWLGYIHSSDVDSTVRSIEADGGQVLMAPWDQPGVGRLALVTDPQGAPFYLMNPIPPADQPDAKSDVFSPDAEQRVAWNELSTSDPEAARAFYTSKFGWSDAEFMDMGEMGKYRFIEQGGQRIGALCGVMPGQQPQWRYYIRVPSIAKAKDAAELNGGTISMGPHQVPTGDYIIIGTDPQGAEFALVGGE